MTEEEKKEALTRFARTVGEAAGTLALAFVAVTAGARECATAFDRLTDALADAFDTDEAP